MKKSVSVFEFLAKRDAGMMSALASIRRAGLKSEASVLARGLYTDSMIPKMGNKMAYNDFLSRNANKGFHVHVDMNDFGQINKMHGEKMGDEAIKHFGAMSQEVARTVGGKSFRNGGDEFKFWFHKPEHAHAFARELRRKLEAHPKVGGTHNLAASIGIGHNPDHAERALLNAKRQLGTTDPKTGKRLNKHPMGGAPTVVHSLTHVEAPAGWTSSSGQITKTPAMSLAPQGMSFHNPLAKADGGAISVPGIPKDHPATSGGRVGMLTAEDPHWPVHTPGENHALEHELKTKGIKYEKIKGKYATEENSFLIHNPDLNLMRDLGKRYGQDSVLYSDAGKHKLVYTNGPHEGKYHPGEGHVVHPIEPERYFSTVTHNGNPLHFTYNVDFDQLHPLNPAEAEPKYRSQTAATEYPQKRPVGG